MEGQSVAAVSDALREAAKSALTRAHTDLEAAAAAERAAKAGRRSLLAEIGSANGGPGSACSCHALSSAT